MNNQNDAMLATSGHAGDSGEIELICAMRLDAGSVLAQLNGFIRDHPGLYADIAQAYCSNVQAVFAVVSMPFAIARQSVGMQLFQRLAMSNELKFALDNDVNVPQQDSRTRAAEDALEEIRSRYRSSEGQQLLTSEVREFLAGVIGNDELRGAARELLRQGLVLSWSAFEVAARDVFITYLNENPSACERLLRDSAAKRRFDVSKISLETLAAHGFNLSGKMGSLLASYQDLSDLISIRTALSPLFGSAGLTEALSSQDLWTLSQKRHVTVHRCGVVDEDFIRNTKSEQKRGQRLEVTPDDLLRHVTAASVACLAIVEAAQQDGRR